MRGLALLFGIFAMQLAFAQPTVYGIVSKEFRNISQHKDFDGDGNTGVTDVDGFESRLGAMGSYDLDGTMVDYKIELGFNSSRDNNAGTDGSNGRLRTRMAYLQFAKDWGTIMIGQNWQIDFLYQHKIDPLGSTGAEQIGLEFAGIEGFRAGYLGMRTQYWDDMLRYSTKSYSGFKYHLTFDRADQTAVGGATNTANPNANRMNYITHHFTYDKDAISAMVWMRGRESTAATASVSSPLQEKATGFTVRYAQGGLSVGLGYTMTDNGEFTNTSGDEEVLQFTHTLLGVGYTMGKNTYGFNYGSTNFGEQQDTAVTGVTDAQGTQTSMSVGWIHKYSDKVSSRLYVSNYSRALPSASPVKFANGEESTTAMVIGVGASVSF